MARKENDEPIHLHEHPERDRIELQLDFGFHLRELRQERELTIERLAERADLHTNYVGSVERGERNVSLYNIWRLANALGITTAELVQTLPLRKVRRSRYGA